MANYPDLLWNSRFCFWINGTFPQPFTRPVYPHRIDKIRGRHQIEFAGYKPCFGAFGLIPSSILMKMGWSDCARGLSSPRDKYWIFILRGLLCYLDGWIYVSFQVLGDVYVVLTVPCWSCLAAPPLVCGAELRASTSVLLGNPTILGSRPE